MKNILLFLFFLICIVSYSQEIVIPVKLLSGVKAGTDTFAGTDAFGAQYSIADNEFCKQANGKTVKYKNLSFGDIYKADIQNPLQIVLFYKEFNAVALLDNQLTEIIRINFSRLPQPIIAEAASLAAQNRLWIYDITTQQIGLLDINQLSYKTITPQLNELLKYYQSDYNYFYWIDITNKCYAVNLFGKVTPLGEVPEHQQAQFVSDTSVLIKKDNGLYLYNTVTKEQKQIDIMQKSFDSFYYNEQILSIFTKKEINHYQITLPK